MCLSVGLFATPVVADPVADFYKDKTITCYIGYGVGGAYDFFGRTISKYMSAHIPGNPTIFPVNLPGASSMLMANRLAKIAPRDGTAFGIVNSALIFDPLFSGQKSKAQFTGPDMTMIGNAVSAAAVLLAWKASGVKTIDDLRSKKLIVGAMTRTGDTYILPLAMKRILQLDNMSIVTGYPGSREAVLALERGEITGRMWDIEAIKAVRPDWLNDGSINLLVQFAPHKMPEVPGDVPLVKEFVADASDKMVLDVIALSTLLARPFIAPPDIPADRVHALRTAFMATMEDPGFLTEMEKSKIMLSPMHGDEFQKIVRDTYALPEAVIQKVRDVLAE